MTTMSNASDPAGRSLAADETKVVAPRMSRMWYYTHIVLVTWVVDAELRRIYGWVAGSPSFDYLLAALPLLSLVPHLCSLTYGGGWKRLPRVLLYAAWVWLGAFMYSIVISLLNGYAIAGAYDFMTFVFPIGIGLWIVADSTSFALVRQRVTRLLFTLATVTSVYGLIQYALGPPWDIAWLKAQIALGVLSYGYPAPFQIRVFSTFLTHHAFADFLAFVLILALPQLSFRKPLLLVQSSVWLIAMSLTLYRTGWLVFVFGAVVYVLLSPRRVALLIPSAIATVLVAALMLVLPAATGNPEMLTVLTSRFTTLSDLDNDYSKKDRQQMYDGGLQMVAAAPLGHGLGVIVTTKVSDKSEVTAFDSGVLGRAVEMGLPGFALYVFAFLLLTGGSIKLWLDARFHRDESLQALAAMAIAANVAFAFEQFSFDANGLVMIVIWLISCLTIRASSPSAVEPSTAQPATLRRYAGVS